MTSNNIIVDKVLYLLYLVTRGRTSDVGKLVAQLHSAPIVACQAERQAVLPRVALPRHESLPHRQDCHAVLLRSDSTCNKCGAFMGVMSKTPLPSVSIFHRAERGVSHEAGHIRDTDTHGARHTNKPSYEQTNRRTSPQRKAAGFAAGVNNSLITTIQSGPKARPL